MTGESTPGWAFLLARGHEVGYQLLLVPDFIAAAGEAALLVDEVRGEVPTHAPPVVANVAGPISGPLCIVYRTIRATRGDIGAADRREEQLLDRTGRPIVLAYGFVCRGSRVVSPNEEDLRAARDAAVATYQRFHAAEQTFRPETSRQYVVHAAVTPVETPASGLAASPPPPLASVAAAWKPDTSRSPTPWTPQVLPGSQPRDPGSHRLLAIVMVLGGALVLLGLAGGSYLLFRGHVPQVRVPNVAEMAIKNAEQHITQASLTWKISCQTAKPSGGFINNRVIGTTPSAGKLVDKDSDVTILVYPCPT